MMAGLEFSGIVKATEQNKELETLKPTLKKEK